jgi:hypothetical protein
MGGRFWGYAAKIQQDEVVWKACFRSLAAGAPTTPPAECTARAGLALPLTLPRPSRAHVGVRRANLVGEMTRPRLTQVATSP